MNSRHLVDRFIACRDQGEPIVLVTVYETLGSTYSKAGTRMLITATGESQGLVSGGCLEGDLADRARRVLDSNQSATVTYDLRDEADELFGLGVGCNGLISVLLQPINSAGAYEPMASIASALLGRVPGAIAVIVDSNDDEIACGASLVSIDGQHRAFGVPDSFIPAFSEGLSQALTNNRASLVANASGTRVLYAPLAPVPRVLILGAGLDAVPLVNILAELGWQVEVGDHRPAYLERPGLSRAERRTAVRPRMLARDLALSEYDAVVVMSHHLATDRDYLCSLAKAEIPYLGLLGPPARKQRLIDDLGEDGQALAARLRGPVGIDIGADTAESIAVSIAAEMQQVLVRAVGSGSRQTVLSKVHGR